jgi:hypothetical protein
MTTLANPISPPLGVASLAGLSTAQKCELIQSSSTQSLLSLAKEAARGLGSYRARLTKQERVSGKLLDPQLIDITLREAPKALWAVWTAGPSKGRRLLYDSTVKPKEMRVREAGFLSIAGAISLSIDNSLALRDTNHTIDEVGFLSLVGLLQKDFVAAAPQGGFTRTDEGLDSRGRWCLKFVAPAGAKGLYAQSAKLCLDLSSALPVVVEVYDGKGLLERYEWDDVAPAPGARFAWSE